MRDKKCWVVMYHHRHGVDAWPVYRVYRPSKKQIIESLDDWEGDTREDEYIEIVGPFDLPEK